MISRMRASTVDLRNVHFWFRTWRLSWNETKIRGSGICSPFIYRCVAAQTEPMFSFGHDKPKNVCTKGERFRSNHCQELHSTWSNYARTREKCTSEKLIAIQMDTHYYLVAIEMISIHPFFSFFLSFLRFAYDVLVHLSDCDWSLIGNNYYSEYCSFFDLLFAPSLHTFVHNFTLLENIIRLFRSLCWHISNDLYYTQFPINIVLHPFVWFDFFLHHLWITTREQNGPKTGTDLNTFGAAFERSV